MRKLSFYLTMCMLFIACTNADVDELRGTGFENGIPHHVVASLDSNDTRIELNDELQTVWTSGDKVSVFYKSTANNLFTYTGATGEKSGTLVRNTSNSGVPINNIIAIYPYVASYKLKPATKSVNINIPATQHHLEGSYGLGDNLMVAVSDNDNLNFRNAYGWIRIELMGTKCVKSLTLSGNNDEQLSGSAALSCASLGLELTAGDDDVASRSTTIDCGNGVQLVASSPTAFYFVVAPQTFSKGFNVEVLFTDGTTIAKSTSKSVAIERNHIQPMKVIEIPSDDSDSDTMPLIVTYPATIYDDTTGEIIILVNAKGTAMEGYTDDIYAHTGLITEKSSSTSNWRYVKAGWTENTEACRLVNLGDDIWQFTIRGGVRTFYGVGSDEEITHIAFVFRSEDGSKEIKENGADILIPIVKRGIEQTQLISTSPLNFDENSTEDIIITLNTTATVMDGFTGDIYAHTGVLTDKSTSVGDWRYVKADWTENTEACKLTNIGDNKWQLTIKGGPRAFYGVPTGESIEYLVFVFRSEDGNVELKDKGEDILIYVDNSLNRRPIGAEYGVSVTGTTATFTLYAPGKSKVHLLADFNGYVANDASLMHKDGNYFWLTVEGLTIGKEYGYQFLVDGTTRVGDPYAEKILDPWNDKYISTTTYPNLKSYPSNASDVVSVFELMPEPYNWSVTNFDRPTKNALAIYELHLRDFTAEGSVKAAMAKLDYLEALGINAIELMPINEFDQNDSWGYNPCFYFAADKAYGREKDYKQFIDECHKRGIAVILDIVINHATGLFPYAKMWWDSSSNCTTDANPFFNRVARHPYNVYHDFNHEYTETRNYFKRMLKFWLEEYKVDGFRFDLSKGLTQKNSGTSESNAGAWSAYDSSRIAIIKDYADAIRSISDDAYIILEHFADPWEENELAAYRDIMLWNNQCEPYYQTTMGYNSNSNFAGDIASGRVSYFESHDEERAAYKAVTYGQSWLKSDWTRLTKQLQGAYCLHFLAPYPKMMWQFGELGYDYSIEYNGRTGKKPVKWDYINNTNRKALYDAISKAISWRTDHEAMYSHEGVSYTYYVGDSDFGGKHLIYNTAEGGVIVVCNFSNSSVSFDISIPVPGTWTNLMTGADVTLGSTYNVSLSGGDYIVLVREQ